METLKRLTALKENKEFSLVNRLNDILVLVRKNKNREAELLITALMIETDDDN